MLKNYVLRFVLSVFMLCLTAQGAFAGWASVYDASTGLYPDEVEPAWNMTKVGYNSKISIVDGILAISTDIYTRDFLYFRQNLAEGQGPTEGKPWVIEASVRYVSSTDYNNHRSPVAIGFTPAIGTNNVLFLEKDRIFLLDEYGKAGSSVEVDTDDAFHVYRIVIDHNGGVEVYYDGELVLEGQTYYYYAYDELMVWWGDGTLGEYGASEWAYIKYGPVETDVSLDIKPGSCLNPLNAKNMGVLPVAIAGSAELDVTTIDPLTIMLAGVAPLRFSYDDVTSSSECTTQGSDGNLDLTLKFDAQELVGAIEVYLGRTLLDNEELTLGLDGELYSGSPITGEDKVTVIKKDKK